MPLRRIRIGELWYATNRQDGGVLVRRHDVGSYTQWAGTAQTPRFSSWQQFRRYLHRHFGVTGRTTVVVGWED